MNANNVTTISLHNPQHVAVYTEDKTPPELQAFNLNLTTEVLTLFFSETVNITSLDVGQITLQHSQSTATGNQTFV